MSKSTGNLIFVRDLLDSVDPMVIRLAVLSQHYRTQEWAWHGELLETAAVRLDQWRSAGEGVGPIDDVRSALDDDLDVPAALTAIDAAARSDQGIGKSAALLGVTL